jgi:hypothetical protein
VVAPVAPPVAVAPPPVATVTPPAPVVPATTPADQADPAWLTSRLARERAKGASTALAAAGFASEADAKAAAEAAKTLADSKKTAETRAIELSQTAASEKARADGLFAIATEHAARMMFGLTPEQQAAVHAVAGDDPAQQLRTIGALSPTWAKPAPAAPVTTPAAPVTTAPAGGAPSGTLPAPTDARGVYEATRSQNPFAAAMLGAANPKVYTPK